MKPHDWAVATLFAAALGCSPDGADTKDAPTPSSDTDGSGDDLPDDDDISDDDSDDSDVEPESLEIVPGVGIGPVQLGDSYGELYEAYGEPDVMTDYNRLFLATWLELGVEIVVGSGQDEAPEEDSIVASVGTRLPDGFHGVVFPGMSRAAADEALGPCGDVIDDEHCFHSAGVYLMYSDDGLIERVAVHPAYTLRPEPPEMLPARGLGGTP